MAMGRTRTRSRAGWPDNLYPNRDGFKYRHPVTRKEIWLGTDKASAFAAAREANAMLTPGNGLVQRIVGSKESIADAIRVFRRDDAPSRSWSAKTAENYNSVIARIERHLGACQLGDLTVRDCADFLRTVTESTRSRQQFRLVLGWILACAVEEGWIESNPALLTRKPTHKRARQRLTIEAYRAIWDQAPAHLRNAMDLSLLTLLRREDVASLRFSDVRDGALWVVPQKTEETSSVRLRIALPGPLSELVARCRDDVASPFLVHRLPLRARPMEKRAAERTHHTQLLPEQISRDFAEAREAAGIDGDNPPTFHEIRSLGGAMLREAGWSKAQVQALMGHSSEAMTQHYLVGHDAPWSEVTTGIELAR